MKRTKLFWVITKNVPLFWRKSSKKILRIRVSMFYDVLFHIIIVTFSLRSCIDTAHTCLGITQKIGWLARMYFL